MSARTTPGAITCSARAFDGSLYSDWANSSELEISNAPPSNVTLIAPGHDTNIINRTPFFNWTTATDIDNDTLYYQLLVDNTIDFDYPEINVTTNSTNYTPTFDLDLTTYYWIVRAYDNESWGANSTKFNFTIISSVVISMPNNTIDFGDLAMSQINDTADEEPYPFIVQNDGNTFIDLFLNSTRLWAMQPLGTQYFQTKVNYTSEPGAFNWSGSQTSWINIANGTQIIEYLNYSDANDSAKIDIRVEVPLDEPTGDKSAEVTIYAKES